MQTAEHSRVEISSGSSTPLLEKNPILHPEDKIASTLLESEVKRPAKILPLISAQELKPGAALHEDITAGLHAGFYREQAVTLLRLSSPVWEKSQPSVQAFYEAASPFWLPVVGVSETEESHTLVMAELPQIRFSEWLRSTAADSWAVRCRLVRDVAVGLYQYRATGATHLTWNQQQLYPDAQGRAQLLPGFSETAVDEAQEVFALAQLLWCVVSRSTTLVNDWEQGKGLPQNCPAEVIALIRACTDSTVSARPSLKTLAKGLDILRQRAEQGFSDTPPLLPQTPSLLQKDQKYEDPAPMNPTATITPTQLSQVQSSGSLNLLLVDDQTVSWLSLTDPRYQVGVKLCALRNSVAQPVESKASLPALQKEIQRTLLASPIEMMLWLGEAGEDPSHSFQETAWRLWQAPHWQAYRPGDPPPAAWLPLFIHLHQPSVSSPVFSRTHQPPEGIANFTDNEWPLLRSQYAIFWLVQGMGGLAEPANLYDLNELHRAQGRTRLLLHSTPSTLFPREESSYVMPHGPEGQLLPARYMRFTTDTTCDYHTWEGRYRGQMGVEVRESTPTPIALTPAKGLVLNRQALILPTAEDPQSTLGKGAFGEVLRGSYDGQPVAVKRFKDAKLSANDQAQLKDEAAVMANLQSPFLIRLLGLSLESPPLLVMELAAGGSLYHVLKDGSQELPRVWRLRVLRDIALGLSVLHAHELLHRDLKSLNILLDAQGRAKLCDFGLSTLKSQARETRDVGTLLWNAPEVLQGGKATPASDMYSFAMICWEVMTRRLPYSDPKTRQLGDRGWQEQVLGPRVIQGHREVIPTDCPPELAVVIQACWAQDPNQRPPASEVAQVLEHVWRQTIATERSPSLARPVNNLEDKRAESSIQQGKLVDIPADLPAESELGSIVFSGSPSLPSAPTDSTRLLTLTVLDTQTTDLAIQSFEQLRAKSAIPHWQDKQSPSYTLGVKLQLLRQKVLADPYITQELSCYIEPNGQSQAGPGQSSQPLYPWVQRELLQGQAQVLLLQGLAGAGKSTFNRSLLRTLWQDPAWQAYRPGDPIPRAPVPVFIPLSSAQVNPRNLWDYYHRLPEISFTSEEIRRLQRDYYTVWIADGYDELPGQAAPNVYEENHLNQTAGRVRLVIGCRSQRVQALNEAKSFVPHTLNGAPDWPGYRTRHLSPFTVRQTQDYIDKYVAQRQNDPERPKDWDAARYHAEFKAIPELQTLIDTPFLLWLTLEILPGLASQPQALFSQNTDPSDEKEEKEKKEVAPSLTGPRRRLTRAALYEAFMEHWFTRQARKAYLGGSYLQEKAAILGESRVQRIREHASLLGGDDVQVHWLKAAYRAFCLSFTEHLWQTGKIELRYEPSSTPEAESNTTAPGGTLARLLGDALPDSARLRQGSPLKKGSDHTWGFMHASLFDYFITTSLVEQLLLTPELGPSGPEVSKGRSFETRCYDRAVALLRQQRLTPDQVRFLVDRTQGNPTLQAVFFQLIERSKTDSAIAVASGNAATVLNVSGVNLCGRDWPGVRIPGTNLRYGILGDTNLSGADLTGADLTRTWLYRTNLEGATLDGVEWGELPRLQCQQKVSAIAYHPHEPWLAIAQGETIEIRHLEMGDIKGQPLTGHTYGVNSVSFSPDGRLLASGSNDKTVRLWSVASQAPQGAPLTGHQDGVMSVSFNPDGRLLASGSNDKTVRLWNVASGESQGAPLWDENSVNSVSFSPDGRLIASGSRGRVRLWNVATRKYQGTLFTGYEHNWSIGGGYRDRVNSVSFSPDGRLVASGNMDETVQLWSVASQKPRDAPLTGHQGNVYSVSFSSDGRLLASGSEDETVRLWNVASGEPQGVPLTGHTDKVWDVSFSPNGRLLASGSDDRTVRLWQVVSFDPQGAPLTGHTDGVSSVSFSPDGRLIASGSMDHTVRLWNVASGEPYGAPLTGHQACVESVSFSPDGRLVASGSLDKTVRLWSVESREPQGAPLTGHTNWVTSVSFSPDGRLVASGSADGLVPLWNVASGESQGAPFEDATGMGSVSYTPSGQKSAVYSVSFSPDGQRVACSEYEKVSLWKVSGMDEICQLLQILTGHKDKVVSVSFSPDSRLLASGSWDKTVRLWQVVSFDPQGAPLTGHTDGVSSVSFSPDGRLLASGSADETVRLWQVASGRCLAVFSWFTAISSIAFHRATVRCTEGGDGHLLAMGDQNGVVSSWWLSAGLGRDSEQAKLAPPRDEKARQPLSSEWKMLSCSRHSRMQFWTQDVQLADCRMSLQSKRLLEQYGADVSQVKLITTPMEKQSLNQEHKDETAPPKPQPLGSTQTSELIPSTSASTATVPSSSLSPLSFSESASTSTSSSSFSPSTLVTEFKENPYESSRSFDVKEPTETKEKPAPSLTTPLSQFQQRLVSLCEDNHYQFTLERSSRNQLLIRVVTTTIWINRKMKNQLTPAVSLLRKLIISAEIMAQQFEIKDNLDNGSLTLVAEPAVLERIVEVLHEAGSHYFSSPLSQVKATLFHRDLSTSPPVTRTSRQESIITCAMQ